MLLDVSELLWFRVLVFGIGRGKGSLLAESHVGYDYMTSAQYTITTTQTSEVINPELIGNMPSKTPFSIPFSRGGKWRFSDWKDIATVLRSEQKLALEKQRHGLESEAGPNDPIETPSKRRKTSR